MADTNIDSQSDLRAHAYSKLKINTINVDGKAVIIVFLIILK